MEDPTINPAATTEEAPEVKNVVPTPVFEVSDLIAAASVYGVTCEIMAGALCGYSDAMTKEKAQARLKDFLARPINKKEAK